MADDLKRNDCESNTPKNERLENNVQEHPPKQTQGDGAIRMKLEIPKVLSFNFSYKWSGIGILTLLSAVHLVSKYLI